MLEGRQGRVGDKQEKMVFLRIRHINGAPQCLPTSVRFAASHFIQNLSRQAGNVTYAMSLAQLDPGNLICMIIVQQESLGAIEY